MQVLKADTGVDVRIGPFVDVGDGFTPQTDIDITGTNEAELLKHDGAATSDISGRGWAAIAGCRGWYDLTLTAGDTDTEGLLTIVVQDDSDCLPVFAHFMVVNANVYDSLYGTAAVDYLDVNAKTVTAGAIFTAAEVVAIAKTGARFANKTSQSKATGLVTVFETDDSTPLWEFIVDEDADSFDAAQLTTP